jgi:hypothetical protein
MVRTSYFLAVSWQEPRTSYFFSCIMARTSYFLAVSWQEQVAFQ